MRPLEEIRDFVNAGTSGEVREAIRVLLRANNGIDEGVETASRTLDTAARRAAPSCRLRRRRVDLRVERHDPRRSREAMADGSWPWLKACRADDCNWAFIDTREPHSALVLRWRSAATGRRRAATGRHA